MKNIISAVSKGAAKLYRWLKWRAGADGECHWRQVRMAQDLKVSLSSIQYWIRELKRAKLIEVLRRCRRTASYLIKQAAQMAFEFPAAMCSDPLPADGPPLSIPVEKPVENDKPENHNPGSSPDHFPGHFPGHDINNTRARSGISWNPSETDPTPNPRPAPSTALSVSNRPNDQMLVDVLFQEFIGTLLATGRPISETDVNLTWRHWIRYDQAEHLAMVSDVKSSILNGTWSGPRYVPLPQNYVRSKAWTRVKVKPILKALTTTDRAGIRFLNGER